MGRRGTEKNGKEEERRERDGRTNLQFTPTHPQSEILDSPLNSPMLPSSPIIIITIIDIIAHDSTHSRAVSAIDPLYMYTVHRTRKLTDPDRDLP